MIELIDHRGDAHRGRTVEAVVRRLYGRDARVERSADPNNPRPVMVVRHDRHGSHVLGTFRAYDTTERQWQR